MHNVEIAWILSELADLTELKGDSPFKAKAYRKVARSLQRYPVNLPELKKPQLLEHLKNLSGVGKSIEGLILEIIETGKSKVLQELKTVIPSELRQLLAIPGLGASRAGTIFKELKITTLDELEKAAKKRLIRNLPGMGSKTEQSILRGIKMLREGTGVVPYGLALALGEEFVSFYQGFPETVKVEISGDIRRGLEIVEKVSLVVATKELKKMVELTGNHPLIKEFMKEEEGYLKFITWLGVTVEIYFVSEAEYIPLLFFSTGSPPHWQRLNQMLRDNGHQLKERELLTVNNERIIIKDESEIYQIADISYIYPELREDDGEVEAAQAGILPKLIEKSGLKGDLHLHTDWSDGVSSIGDMAEKAAEMGYEYIAITDHSKSLGIAKGLQEDRLARQHHQIKELNMTFENFTILTGIEMDILSDGKLDYSDELLEEMDVVIASIHSGFKQDKNTITERIINAIKNEHVDVIAHPTGRLLGRRKPYEVDMEKVLEMAAKYNTALEINSSIDRLDLNYHWVRKAKALGIKIAINTDAHDTHRMEEIKFGIGVGRKGWLQTEEVINCLSLKELKKYLNSKN